MNNLAAIGFRASLLGLLAVPILAEVASAQIVPDGSLPNNSIVLPDGNTFTLEGGTTAGNNLFHSFSEFSVPTGSAAIFNSAPTIDNILTRVTGSSISNIDGLLSANGPANLFLLNPNGIVFGPNASLDIGGSFVGTTADAVEFADGTMFSTSTEPSSSLLTVSVPVGLQLGREPGEIVNRSVVGLSVPTQQTLALIGGDVNLSGGNLSAPEGRIELGSVGDSSRVSLTPQTEGFTFGYEMADSFGNVRLSEGAQVDVSGSPSGTVNIRAGTFQLLPNSRIVALNSGSQPGGDINIVATELVELVGLRNYTEDAVTLVDSDFANPSSLPETGIFAATSGRGRSANINIETQQTVARESTFIATMSNGLGDSGNLTVNASESVDVSASRWDTGTNASVAMSGDGGNVTVNTGQLRVREAAILSSQTRGMGRAGNIVVNAIESIEVLGTELLFAERANGESLAIGTALFSISGGSGNAGEIHLFAPRLFARDGGTISAVSSGTGAPGRVIVNASDSVELVGTLPGIRGFSTALRAGASDPSSAVTSGGEIRVRTSRLILRDRGALTVDTIVPSAGGNIDIVADSILLDPGFITAETAVDSGGNIRIQTGNLQLRDESEITVTAQSSINPDFLTAEQLAAFNSFIGTAGDGGNLTINADTIVALENSDIRADAPAGFGGQVSITSQGIFGTEFRDVRTEESDITAVSALGVQFNGTVSLQTPDVDTNNGLIELPTEVIETSDRVATGCGTADGSEFTVIGRGGVPEAPGDGLRGQTVWQDLRSLNTGEETTIVPETSPSTPVWVEAQRWTRHENGTVELLARSSPSPFAEAALDCETLSSDRALGVD